MRIPLLLTATGLCLAFTQASLFGGPIPSGKPTTYPDWWFERDVIPRLPAAENKANPVWPTDYPAVDDFSVANIGQLKSIFSKAAEELNAAIADGGAGSDVNARVAAWQSPPAAGVSRDDFAALNQGQLKATAQLIYRRLRQLGYFGSPLKGGNIYPWGDAGSGDAYALVNLGQLKHVFCFFSVPIYLDAYLADADLDGIPNGWEIENGLDPFNSADSAGTSGGLTNLQIFQASLSAGADPLTINAVGLLVYSP